MGRSALFIFMLAALAGILSAGCSACSRDAVAELTASKGSVEVSRAGDADDWSATDVGVEFRIGDGVRTGDQSSATVQMNSGARLQLVEDTTIRFTVVEGQDSAFQLDVETGSAQLEVGERRLSFDTSVGRAVLSEGTTVELTAGEGGRVTFAVLVGSAQLDAGNGVKTLGAGESIDIQLEMGKATILEELDASLPDAGVTDAAAPAKTLRAVVKGRRVKARTPGAEQWQTLKPGETGLKLGTELQIPPRAQVSVSAGDQSAVIRGRAQVVVGGPEALVDATGGADLTIEAVTLPVAARVLGGTVTAKPRKGGSAANLAVNRRSGKADIRVAKGFVDVAHGKEINTLAIGETATLDRAGQLTIANRAPEIADMSLPAGETAVLHDRRGRTALRVVFGTRCPGEGRVEMTNRRGRSAQQKSVAEGVGSARVWAERGVNSYTVQCLKDGVPVERAARGRIYVRRDAGTQRLPRRPTRSPPMDADGRSYTVSYQNLLPILTFKWSKAPQARAYKVVVKPLRDDPLEVTVKRARHTFKAGKISEGQYTFWFEPLGTTRKSKVSRLNVTFDNAAPTAYIRAPAHGARWDDSVHVAGVALKGWKVSIGGVDVALDGQHRFDTSVAAPRTEQAIAIRLSHPKRGNHYYLRRRGR